MDDFMIPGIITFILIFIGMQFIGLCCKAYKGNFSDKLGNFLLLTISAISITVMIVSMSFFLSNSAIASQEKICNNATTENVLMIDGVCHKTLKENEYVPFHTKTKKLN